MKEILDKIHRDTVIQDRLETLAFCLAKGILRAVALYTIHVRDAKQGVSKIGQDIHIAKV